jgi:membrane associated rhomboid family serine protease/predicted RNA-binding Zn-ribbon protein involved in translation (DUF1610 family)
MADQAELFTVCSSCGQQVSTFVTECPYCGTRLQKRAPRLDRKDGDLEALLRLPTYEPDRPGRDGDSGDDDNVVPLKPKRRSVRDRIPKAAATKPRKAPRQKKQSSYYATEGKAYATFAIVLLALIGLPVEAILVINDLALFDGSPIWRSVTAALTFGNTWNALAVLTTFGVFGWLWERRAGLVGSLVVVVAFLAAGVGGLLLDRALSSDSTALFYGAAGPAIALATAWIVCELRARRANEALDGDVMGATVLLVVPIATTILTADAVPVSIALGLALGAAMGLALSLAKR